MGLLVMNNKRTMKKELSTHCYYYYYYYYYLFIYFIYLFLPYRHILNVCSTKHY